MAPSPIPKTKAQHLERVRQNQQRSRQRKRAYVARLEQEIGQLRDESGPTSDISSEDRCPIQAHARLQSENDARRDLLLHLGVTVPAQELFVSTFIARSNRPGDSAGLDDDDAVRLHGPDTFPEPPSSGERPRRCPDHSVELCERCHSSSSSNQSDRPDHLPPDLSSVSPFLDPQPSKCTVARFLVPLTSNATTLAGRSNATAASSDPSKTTMSQKVDMQPQPPQTSAETVSTFAWPLEALPSVPSSTPSRTVTVQPFFAGSLPNVTNKDPPSFSQVRHLDPTPTPRLFGSAAAQSNNLWHVPNNTSDGTTACKIAASLITINNAVGYSAEELDSKLQVGYLVAGIGDEDCRILNRVLFAVLAEISWAPP